MDGPTEAQNAEAIFPRTYSQQVLVMGLRPRPPVLLTRTASRNGFCDVGLQSFLVSESQFH